MTQEKKDNVVFALVCLLALAALVALVLVSPRTVSVETEQQIIFLPTGPNGQMSFWVFP